MRAVLPSVEVNPKGAPVGTVLWLHGLGADGHDFESLVPLLGLPNVRFVFPHAPTRPVTVNGGAVMRAWYDLEALGEENRGREDQAGIHEAAELVRALIEREGERGVPPSRIILAGYSQGGAVALYVGTRYTAALLGIMVLSAYELLVGEPREESGANAQTPLLFCHGLYDPMVPVASGREAYAAANRGGRPSEWHEFPMGHQVIPEEILVIREWLKARFDSKETP